MTKTVKKLMLAAAGLFALGIMIPVLALTMAGRNVAGAKGSSVLDGTLVLKDKYADKVDGTPDAEIVLATDAPSDCRFFRITRAD